MWPPPAEGSPLGREQTSLLLQALLPIITLHGISYYKLLKRLILKPIFHKYGIFQPCIFFSLFFSITVETNEVCLLRQKHTTDGVSILR